MGFIKRNSQYITEDIQKGYTNVLPSGAYRADYFKTMFNDGFTFTELDHRKNNSLQFLPTPEFNTLKFMAKSFFSGKGKNIYKTVGAQHFFGAILYGPPGTGKTVSINLLLNDSFNEFEKESGKYYALFISSLDALIRISRIYQELNIQPEDKVFLIFEEADHIFSSSPGAVSFYLEFSDGLATPQNTMAIMTTNHPNSLPNIFFQRPGRFALILEISPLKTRDIMEYYIKTTKPELQELPGFKVFLDKLSNTKVPISIDHAKFLLIQCLITESLAQIEEIGNSNKIELSSINKFQKIGNDKQNFWKNRK